MTAVSVAMTGASAPALSMQSRTATEPGLAVYVGLGNGDVDRGLLVDLARALTAVIAEMAPRATTYSALTFGRGAQADILNRLRKELAPADMTPYLASWPVTQRSAARVRVVPDKPEVIVDLAAREVTIAGRPVPFTHKEFSLLEYLLRSPHRAISREELLERVWHKRAWRDGTRTIDVHVRRLREKLGGSPQIVTVRGVGYRCDPTPEVVLVGSGDAD